MKTTRSYSILALAVLVLFGFASCSSPSDSTSDGNGTTSENVGPKADATLDPQFGSGVADSLNRSLGSGPVYGFVNYKSSFYGFGAFQYAHSSKRPMRAIFRWTGSTIDSVPMPTIDFGQVTSIDEAEVMNNLLYAHARYEFASSDEVMTYDGSTWAKVGTYPYGGIGFASDGSTLYVGHVDAATYPDPDTSRILKWNGSSFDAFGDYFCQKDAQRYEKIVAITAHNGAVYVATNQYHPTSSISFNDSGWVYKVVNGTKTQIGAVQGKVSTLKWIGDKMYVLGDLEDYKDGHAVDVYDGSTYAKVHSTDFTSTFAEPSSSNGIRIVDIAVDKSGALYVATNKSVVKFDGSTMTTLATVTGGYVNAVAILGNKLFIGGDFYTVNGVSSSGLAILR